MRARWLLGLVLALTIVGSGVFGSAAQAVGAGGAVVSRDKGCIFIDERGRTLIDSEGDRLIVTRPDGSTFLLCTGQAPDYYRLPQRPLTLQGFPCFGGPQSRELITPSGRIVLVCSS